MTQMSSTTGRVKNAQNMISDEIDTYLKLQTNEIISQLMKSENIICPNCLKCEWTDIRNFNLMFETKQ